ncbi:MAG: hypothetical protein MZW92_25200 [Comamonadaceae bacterium]|nr:hypothetical protein [Comamonadaceae bacterium]
MPAGERLARAPHPPRQPSVLGRRLRSRSLRAGDGALPDRRDRSFRGARRLRRLERDMSLRLKINLLVALLMALFVGVLVALQIDNNGGAACMRRWMRRVSSPPSCWAASAASTAEQDQPALADFIARLGRVRANDIALYDETGRLMFRTPPSAYKFGRDAPAWFSALVLPQIERREIALAVEQKLVIEPDASRGPRRLGRTGADGGGGRSSVRPGQRARLLAAGARHFAPGTRRGRAGAHGERRFPDAAAAPAGVRGGAHEQRLQPHGAGGGGEHGRQACGGAGGGAPRRPSRADAAVADPYRGRAARHCARAARRTGPVRHRHQEHRAGHRPARPWQR